MGIHGIYKEIGPGQRIALSKIALQKFEETGRPLRIAIDTSIWLFQIQASKGGTNPALRTFYYRLLRLLALAIHPIFVFDGPNKPPFKRNKRTGHNVASIPEFLAKQLLKQFGYPIHPAPGEAEAECALLQREGIVDVVLSEDVDTLMFGSGVTIRNWSPEKSGKTPTHVNVYDAIETKTGPSGLDRNGMILVALMSGGDYVPEGIPGCGPKTACEAARAGFGDELCSIPRHNADALSEWRTRLQHELKTNQSKLFKRRHGALVVPDDFPRLDILGYYTHPAISNRNALDKLRCSIQWDPDLDFPGLREFTRDAFDWTKLEGAKHFIRSLAPSLLVQRLRLRAERHDQRTASNLQGIREDETLLVEGLHGKRQHPVTDHCTELRVSFVPIELVKIDLGDEEPDDEFEEPPASTQVVEVDLDDDSPMNIEDNGPRKRGLTKFDPEKAVRVWVMESFVKVGVPLTVQDWEAERRTRLKPQRTTTEKTSASIGTKAKSDTRRAKKADGLPQSSIQQFTKVTKPATRMARSRTKTPDRASSPPEPNMREQADIVDLRSPSPVSLRSRFNLQEASPGQRDVVPFPDLPASVTKRRRRGPLQRSHTLPSNLAEPVIGPSKLQLDSVVETLDLIESPSSFVRSHAQTQNNLSIPEPRQEHPINVPTNTRQSTIDAWRASLTPKKPRDHVSSSQTSPSLRLSNFEVSTNDLDTLDLTMSSPLPELNISFSTRIAPTYPDKSTLRNGQSQAHDTEQDDDLSVRKPRKRRSDEIEAVDLTLLSSPISETVPKWTDIKDAVRLVSSHATAMTQQSSTIESCAVKDEEKKRRHIILRQSVAGAWDFADVEISDTVSDGGRHSFSSEKDRRRWRESEVELLDFT